MTRRDFSTACGVSVLPPTVVAFDQALEKPPHSGRNDSHGGAADHGRFDSAGACKRASGPSCVISTGVCLLLYASARSCRARYLAGPLQAHAVEKSRRVVGWRVELLLTTLPIQRRSACSGHTAVRLQLRSGPEPRSRHDRLLNAVDVNPAVQAQPPRPNSASPNDATIRRWLVLGASHHIQRDGEAGDQRRVVDVRHPDLYDPLRRRIRISSAFDAHHREAQVDAQRDAGHNANNGVRRPPLPTRPLGCRPS
jgi:hypothetical protein